MRLPILDNGHGIATKTLFAVIRTVSRQPVLDVVKLVRYRPGFYGKPMSAVTQNAMRGPSLWSVGDREFMAAFIAKTNGSEFCTEVHSAVAQRAYSNGLPIAELMADPDLLAVEQPLRATLLMLRKLTRETMIAAADIQQVFAAGASQQQIDDALEVCFSFNIMSRLADAFGFEMPTSAALTSGAKYLLARGYR